MTLVKTFPPEDSPKGNGVHTFDIIDAGEYYLGYAGPVHAGPVDVWQSDSSDLSNWTKIGEDILPGRSRWATAEKDGNDIILVVSRPVGGITRRLGQATSLKGRVPSLAGDRSTFRLELWRSSGGLDFEFDEVVVNATDTGFRTNRNPNLFTDPRTGRVGLVYYAGEGGIYQIRWRESESVAGITGAEDIVLAQSDSLLAAPAIAVTGGQYYLLTEAVKKGRWITEAYPIESPSTPVDLSNREVLFEDQEACPFPAYINGEFYLFTSRAMDSVTPPGIDGRWEGRLYKFPKIQTKLDTKDDQAI